MNGKNKASKKLRLRFPALLIILLFALFSSSAFAEGVDSEFPSPELTASADTLSYLKINPYGGAADDIDTVNWFSANGKYYLFLPADCALDSATVYYEASGSVLVNGQELVSGAVNTVFTDAGDYTLTVGESSYSLKLLRSANVPAVFIETESGSLDYIHADKEHKEAADIRVYEDGEMTVDSELKHIKGRGNATWDANKKPYNIKFDKKTKLLGMPKAKKWTLLACNNDIGLCDNIFGWEYAERFGLPYTSEYCAVDLYINNDYLGTYIICESVEVGDNRIEINDLDKANEEANPDIEDLSTLPQRGTSIIGTQDLPIIPGSMKWLDIPNDPDDISGGYLLEFEVPYKYIMEPCGFIASNSQCFTIKSPECATEAEVRYIYSKVDPAIEAIYSETGYNSLGKHYSEYFDMDSLINMYILQELTSNLDACISSFYMYKPENSDKLYLSPVWDLDNGYSNHGRYGGDHPAYDSWWVNSVYAYTWAIDTFTEIPIFYYAAYEHDDFRTLVSERWAEILEKGIIDKGIKKVSGLVESYASSAVMNCIRWNYYGTDDPASVLNSYRSSYNGNINFIRSRTNSLTKGYAEDSAMLYYDANGGLGWLYQPRITSIGDSLTVLEAYHGDLEKIKDTIMTDSTAIIPSVPGMVFDCWNTCADGSGDIYYPGDTITLNDRTTVLYAQWKPYDEHTHNFTASVHPASCSCGGYTVHTCASCRMFYVNNFTLPLGHDCNADGFCTRCNNFISSMTLSAEKRTAVKGETVEFTANVKNLPAGARVKWTVLGLGSSYTVSEDSLRCTVSGKYAGIVSVTATLVNANGRVLTDTYNIPVMKLSSVTYVTPALKKLFK